MTSDFETLFLAYYEDVYRLLYRITGTRQEAEDLAQETFLRLYHHEFAPAREHNVRAWLLRVATNLAYNAHRSRRRRHEREITVTREAIVLNGTPPDPVDVVMRSDTRETVRAVLDTLSEHQAKLLLLRHAGLSYRELADALEVSPNSIGTMLARAMAAFEDAYREIAPEKGAPS